MKKLLVISMTAAMMLGSGMVYAAGNAEAGKAKSAVCGSCHGADGNGMPDNPLNPKLADQVPGYITTQLKAFKSGDRQDPIMAGMVAALSDEDMADLDAYYSSMQVKGVGIKESDREMALLGEKLYRGGSRRLSISACMSCHGPSGEGVPKQYPSLSGQYAAYVEKQLHAFKDGVRKHEMMNSIGFLLSNDEIKGLALYVQGLK